MRLARASPWKYDKKLTSYEKKGFSFFPKKLFSGGMIFGLDI
jgi:hypothetical protein